MFPDSENSYVQNIKRSVREAALSVQSCSLELSQDNQSDDSSEHFFVPLSGTGFSRVGQDTKLGSARNKLLFASQDLSIGKRAPKSNAQSKRKELRHVQNDLDSFQEYDGENDFLSGAGSNCTVSDSQTLYYDDEEARDQVFSPSLLLDTSLMGDFYEDLLGGLVYYCSI